MDFMNWWLGDLTLSPEYIFIARAVILVLCVEVATSLVALLSPLSKVGGAK